jgi:probable F420-dependent oxidoreductase
MPLGDRRPGVMLPGGLGMDAARRLAAESEAAGAEAVWVADVRREPYLLSTAALMDTKNVEVGTNVAVAFPRSPALTAQAAWDLNGWSGGRFVLGLGSQVRGTLENRFGVSAEHPGPMLRDYVEAVRACFKAYREGHGRYQGDYYRIRQPVFMPGADDWPEPAIYVAGVNPLMTEVAGQCADGFAAHMYSTEAYLDEVIAPALAKGAEATGRSKPVVLLSIVVGPDREALARQMTTYTVPGYRRVLDHAGLVEEGTAILDAIADRRRSDAQRLIDEKVLDLLAVTTVEDLEGAVRRWAPHADRLALSVPWFGIPDDQQAEIFREVLKALERL